MIRVLLVEDHPMAQKLASVLLKSLNCHVETASDGKTALEQFQSNPFDLVLLDIGLPDMSGLEVAAKIREVEKKSASHTPIIALTAHIDDAEKNKGLSSGIDEFYNKPLTSDTGKQILEKISNKK